MLTEGKEDAQTPAISTEALAAAAGLDRIGETFDSSEALELAGSIALGEVAGGNQVDWEGAPVTALLAQYSDRDHFAVFYDRGAADLYRDFLAGALGGEAPGVVRVED